MTPTSRPARAAHQLAQLLDNNPTGPHHHQAARLVTLAHLLATVGHLAQQRAHDQTPGIRATNTDPRGSGLSDPTATTALHNLAANDDTINLEHQLRTALTDLDNATRRLTDLITKATTVHRTDTHHHCTEALCESEAAPGRLGYCEADYRRRLRWAHANPDLEVHDWDPNDSAPTSDQRRAIHQAPPLTHAQLADRAIRKRRKTA